MPVQPAEIISAEIIDDAFELIYLISALSNLEAVMSRNPAVDHVLDDAQVAIEPRLAKRLISLAGNLRNFVFENWPDSAGESDRAQAQDRNVGRLLNGDNDVDLSLRTACNKLVHANKIAYAGTIRVHARLNLNDCVEVSGRAKNEKPWTALINVPEFAAGAYVSAAIVAGAK